MSSYQVFPILLESFWRDFKPISVTFEIIFLVLDIFIAKQAPFPGICSWTQKGSSFHRNP